MSAPGGAEIYIRWNVQLDTSCINKENSALLCYTDMIQEFPPNTRFGTYQGSRNGGVCGITQWTPVENYLNSHYGSWGWQTQLICRGENIENGVDCKFLPVSTTPRIDFHLKIEEKVVKVNS